jgi:DNA-binding MltR family transcriptional regulator
MASGLPPGISVPPELELIIDEIREQPDRGAAILAGSILSEFLARAIIKAFSTETSNRRRVKLFEGFGPLSSFSARIEIAYSMAVVDDDATYNDLIVIKDIRNAFAHSIEPMSFQSDEIKHYVKKLKNTHGPTERPGSLERRQFMLAVIFALLDLTGGAVPDFY